jgi:hypothetical protein
MQAIIFMGIQASGKSTFYSHQPAAQRVPEKGIRGTHARLVIPKYDEGFDELYYVRLLPDGGFDIAEWTNEV